MENLVILGSGPAGLTAALYAARANLAPRVVDGRDPGGQLMTTTDVENFPGFPEGVTGPDLVERMRKQAERFGARFAFDEVTSASFRTGALEVALSGGERLSARAVIVATGASARYLGIPSEQALIGKGVSACATCDGALFRGRAVAVVGGGDSAMEEALFLTRLCSRVTLVHRRAELRASKIMGERARANPKIEWALGMAVDEVLDPAAGVVRGLRLRNVATGERRELAVDGLFLAIGHTPNTAPFRGQLELDEQGFIVADQARTNVPGVFAAGDVQDPRFKQAVTAAGSGCMAALQAERFLIEHGS
jgi:thioredoxin reductase (NADPH)